MVSCFLTILNLPRFMKTQLEHNQQWQELLRWHDCNLWQLKHDQRHDRWYECDLCLATGTRLTAGATSMS